MSDVEFNVVSESKPTIWAWDWACASCGAYGYIKVETTGGPIKPGGGMYPRTSDEDVQRLRWDAHSQASPLCIGRRFLKPSTESGVPLLWRRERKGVGWRMVWMPDNANGEYRWPPALPPWVPK